MADNTDISQAISEIGADVGSAQISQLIAEIASEASGGAAQISQEVIEIGANASTAVISQLTIELGRGPEVIPPADTPVGAFTFDEGLGNTWFIVPQLSDSGIELRDKVVKPFRVTGKVSNARGKIYRYGPTENIDIDAIEAGTGYATVVPLIDTTQVVQSKRHPVNVPNAMLHTIRIEGQWDGTGERDRIDEIIYEVAQQGIRR